MKLEHAVVHTATAGSKQKNEPPETERVNFWNTSMRYMVMVNDYQLSTVQNPFDIAQYWLVHRDSYHVLL